MAEVRVPPTAPQLGGLPGKYHPLLEAPGGGTFGQPGPEPSPGLRVAARGETKEFVRPRGGG